MYAMPFKVNADRRHHIPKQQHRVTNWSEYDAALRQRGSLTIWFTDEAIAAWRAEPRTTRGGQPHYSALAITMALTLRTVFRLPLRQTEGLIGSVILLLGLDLAVPDHSTLSRRAETLRYHVATTTFLEHPDAPPDNNGSERELRPTATYRKVTGGFRSKWGADLFAGVRSVAGTAARQVKNAYQAICAVLDGESVIQPG
jgi:hypothetical protein